jgi:hypothetical protein
MTVLLGKHEMLVGIVLDPCFSVTYKNKWDKTFIVNNTY